MIELERNIMWVPLAEAGLEHLSLRQNNKQIVADGLVIGTHEHLPFRLRYEIHCDEHWRVRKAHLSMLLAPFDELHLHADGSGSWTTQAGEALTDLAGCLDVDIQVSPFTNTIPIRRLNLKPGEACDLTVVYFTIPQMQARPFKQRYTCLETTAEGGRYRYESLLSGFTAELSVDSDGIVLDYPEAWRRVEI